MKAKVMVGRIGAGAKLGYGKIKAMAPQGAYVIVCTSFSLSPRLFASRRAMVQVIDCSVFSWRQLREQ